MGNGISYILFCFQLALFLNNLTLFLQKLKPFLQKLKPFLSDLTSSPQGGIRGGLSYPKKS